MVEPLYEEERGNNVWLAAHDLKPVTLPRSKVRVLDHSFSERMVPDRVSNPHGEHAEGVWELDTASREEHGI